VSVLEMSNYPHIEIVDDRPILKFGNSTYIIPKLKHGVIFLMISTIARQYADCEYRIHLDYSKGRTIRREMIDGIVEHRRQLKVGYSFDDVDIDPKPGDKIPILINVGFDGITYFNYVMRERWIINLLNSSNMDRKFIREPTAVIVFNNVPILAQPDLLILNSGKVRLIVELKTCKDDSRKISRSDIIQASLYGYVFDKLNIDFEGIMLVKLRRGSKISILDSLDFILKNFESCRNFYSRDISIVNVKYSRDVCEKIIDWALQYWLHLRNPQPKPSDRCRFCSHRHICGFSRYTR